MFLRCIMVSALTATVSLIFSSILAFTGAKVCTPDSNNPCGCTVAGEHQVDLTNLFKKNPLSVKADKYTYTVDACKKVDCSSGSCKDSECAGCQVQGNEKFGLGSLKSTTYDLSGEEGKWKLTATYKDGQDSRQMVVTFQYTKGADIKLKYDEENPPKHYAFTVTGEYTVAAPKPTPSPSSRVDPGVVGIVLIVL